MAGPALLLLRLALAIVCVAHGAHQLFGVWSGPGIGAGGLDQTAAAFAANGNSHAFALAVTGSLIEFAGGILLGFGWLTRTASAIVTIDVAVGLVMFHLPWGFFLNYTGVQGRGQGIEFQVVVIGALLCLLIGGPGSWSIDGWRMGSKAARAAGRARLRGKI